MLKEGKGEPLDLMKKYYGRSMMNFDEFLNNVNLQAGSPRDLATRVLSEVELIPQFAQGGLARNTGGTNALVFSSKSRDSGILRSAIAFSIET